MEYETEHQTFTHEERIIDALDPYLRGEIEKIMPREQAQAGDVENNQGYIYRIIKVQRHEGNQSHELENAGDRENCGTEYFVKSIEGCIESEEMSSDAGPLAREKIREEYSERSSEDAHLEEDVHAGYTSNVIENFMERIDRVNRNDPDSIYECGVCYEEGKPTIALMCTNESFSYFLELPESITSISVEIMDIALSYSRRFHDRMDALEEYGREILSAITHKINNLTSPIVSYPELIKMTLMRGILEREDISEDVRKNLEKVIEDLDKIKEGGCRIIGTFKNLREIRQNPAGLRFFKKNSGIDQLSFYDPSFRSDGSEEIGVDGTASSGDRILSYRSPVVVIDDENSIVEIITRKLESSGINVEYKYNSGTEAVEKLEDLLPDKNIGCLIIDYKMSGLDGVNTVKKLLESLTIGKIVFISGNIDDRELVRGIKEIQEENEDITIEIYRKPLDVSKITGFVSF